MSVWTPGPAHPSYGLPLQPAAEPWLPAGSWSRLHAACITCGRTEIKHAANGRCSSCDKRWREAGGPS